MVEHVLAVAGAVAHAAQQLDELGVQAVDIGLEHGALALGLNGGVHLPLGLLHHLLDAGGMDAAVLDELLQGDAGDFPAHRVEAGDGDGLRRVVDDQIHAGHGLQRADVAALAADDAALHLVIGQGNHRDGGFGHMVGGAALNGQGQDLLGAGVGLLLELGLDLPHLHGRLMGDLLGKLVDEVVLGLLGGEAGDALQHLHLGLLDGGHLVPGLVQLGQLALQGVLLLLDVLGLAVQVLFLLLEPPLLLLQIGPALLHLALILVAGLENLLLGLHQRLPLLTLGALDGLVDDALGLLLRTVDLFFRGAFADLNADGNAYDECDHGRDHTGDDSLHQGFNTPPYLGFSKFFFMKRMHALPPALGQSAQNLKSLPLVLQNITPYLF